MAIRTASFLIPAALLLLLSPAASGEDKKKEPKGKTVLELRVDRALKQATTWFRKVQNSSRGKKGAWSFREPYWESGTTALALFTMLRAGVDLKDPMIRAGFDYIAKNVSAGKRPTEMYTYNVSTQMLAIEAGFHDMLFSRTPGNATEKALLAIFEANFDYCRQALKGGEAGYTIDQQGLDVSNTQYLVMALEAAHRVNFRLEDRLWFEILEKCLSLQSKDGPDVHRVNILSRKGDEVDKHGYVIRDRYGWISGKPAKARGWTYGEFFKKDEIYGSMTCAGVANLLSCFFVLEKNPEFKKKYEKQFRIAVRDGLAWLQKYYAVNANPAEPSFWSMGRLYKGDTFWTYYYLFTLARITRATNIRFIGNRNWYQEGVDFLLKAQRPDGSWDQVAHETHNFKSDCIPIVNTSFALWFFSSLDHTRLDDPEAEAKAAREGGKVPEKEADLVLRLRKLIQDTHRPMERWDVDSPFDGTADLIYGFSVHPSYGEGRQDKKIKEAAGYLLGGMILSQSAMDNALKKVRAKDTMTLYYTKHLLFERWQTKTLMRFALSTLGHGMSRKDWEKIEKAKGGAKIKVASGAKRMVGALCKHMAGHAKKVGRDKLGWTDTCGRPLVLRPDAGNTASVLRAFHAAALCGISQSSGMWKGAARFLLTCQEEKGPEADLWNDEGKPSGKKAQARGFGVLPGDPAELELTLHVLSALALSKTYGKLKGSILADVEKAIDSGLAWLTLHFPGYYRFSLLVAAKRCGILLKRRYLGKVDWKTEGLKFIGFQDESRGFLTGDAARRVAFALYFLSPRFLA